jgi:hypothetical protein
MNLRRIISLRILNYARNTWGYSVLCNKPLLLRSQKQAHHQ